MKRTRAIAPSTDRTLPKTFGGTLEPNWWCRGWNPRRLHYCGSRAGTGTSHPGSGRCKFHGGLSLKKSGDNRVRHGRQSRQKREELRDLIVTEQQRTDPLDLTGELATLRALVTDLRQRRKTVDHNSELKLADSIGRMVERIERIRGANAISRPELNRIMHEMWRAIDGRIVDETIKGAIREDWMRISL